jgi:hypothetical protein
VDEATRWYRRALDLAAGQGAVRFAHAAADELVALQSLASPGDHADARQLLR